MKKTGFTPIRLQEAPVVEPGSDTKVTVTSTLKGIVADKFEEMRTQSGLNKSQLVTQMIYHCLGKSEELKNFYRRLAILGD